MPDQEMLSQPAYGRSARLIQSFNSKQHLMLLRLQPFGSSSLFTKVQEFSDLVSEIGKVPIVSRR
jgi:hypothetical protein